MAQKSICELWRRCAAQEEDETGWEALVARLGRRIRSGVRRALLRYGASARPERVQEMVQEVYCRLLERDRRVLVQCRGRTENEIAVYLDRVAASVVVDLLRAESAFKRGRALLVALDGEAEAGYYETAVDPAPSPEQRAVLRDFKNRCSDHFRSVIVGPCARRNVRILELALLEGWSSRDIAESVGGKLKPSSIDSLLHRMRSRLGEIGVSIPPRIERVTR